MGESTEVDNSFATSLKTCQKSLSTEGAAVENEISYPTKEGSLFSCGDGAGPEQPSIQRKTEEYSLLEGGPGENRATCPVKRKKTIAGCFPESPKAGQHWIQAGRLRVPGACVGDTFSG